MPFCCRFAIRASCFYRAVRITEQDGGCGAVRMGLNEEPRELPRSVAWAGEVGYVFAVHDRELTRDVRGAPGLLGKRVREGELLLDNDVSARSIPSNTRRLRAVEIGYCFVLVLPPKVSGCAAGLFGMMSRAANCFTDDEIRPLKELSDSVAFAREAKEKEKHLNYLFDYNPQPDCVTGRCCRSA